MTSGLDLPLLCRLSYEVGRPEKVGGTIELVNRGEEKVRVHMDEKTGKKKRKNKARTRAKQIKEKKLNVRVVEYRKKVIFTN